MELPVDLLKSFVAVHDAGSFTHAGQVLGRTQSAVSMQMKRLEQTLGQRLFSQTGRSFCLTPSGETLLTYARRILSLHEEALSAVAGPALDGQVRFGASEDYASRMLPRVLARFSAAYPNIRVDVSCEPSDRLWTSVQKGALDLALCTEIPDGGTLVHREPVVWIASAGHRIHEKTPLPLAVYPEGCVFRKWATEALRRRKRPFRIAYVNPSIAGIQAAVSAGLAVAPIWNGHVAGRLQLLGPDDGFPRLPAAGVYLHRFPGAASEAVSCFSDFVASSFSAAPDKADDIGPRSAPPL